MYRKVCVDNLARTQTSVSNAMFTCSILRRYSAHNIRRVRKTNTCRSIASQNKPSTNIHIVTISKSQFHKHHQTRLNSKNLLFSKKINNSRKYCNLHSSKQQKSNIQTFNNRINFQNHRNICNNLNNYTKNKQKHKSNSASFNLANSVLRFSGSVPNPNANTSEEEEEEINDKDNCTLDCSHSGIPVLHSDISIHTNTNDKNEHETKSNVKQRKPEKHLIETITITIPTQEENEKQNALANRGNDAKIDRRAYPIALSSLLMGTAIGIVIPIMPSFATDIGINTLEYGLVISVMGWTRLAFNIPAAFYVEKYGRRPLLIGGPLAVSIGMAMTGTVHSLYGLLGWRFLVGAGGSLQMAGAQTYLADISNSKNRARTMAPMQLGFSAGMALGPAIGGILADIFSVRETFFITGLAILGVCINNHIQCPETKIWKQSHNNNILKKDNSLIVEFKNTLSQWLNVCKNKNNQYGFLVHTSFWCLASGVMFTLMPLFATNTLNMVPSQLGGLFALTAIINVILSQPMAWLSDKYGRKLVIVPGCIIVSSGAICLPYVTNIIEIGIVCGVWSIGATMMGSGPMAYISDNNGNDTRSQALAVLRSCGDLGLMIGSGALGYIAYISDMQTATTIGALTLVGSAINFGFRATNVSSHKHH